VYAITPIRGLRYCFSAIPVIAPKTQTHFPFSPLEFPFPGYGKLIANPAEFRRFFQEDGRWICQTARNSRYFPV
jgi:hypothetical protein